MSPVAQSLNRLMEFIGKEQLIESGDKVLLACSGGADSTAMLYLFSKLRHSMHLSLLAVHINHQLRGVESDADEAAVKSLCLKLNIPVIVRRIDLDSAADLENQARKKRFAVFNQILEIYKFGKVLLAHHGYDQAETLLMNLFRGAGVAGLAGIKPRNGNVIHPMLCFNPVELREVLNEAEIPWREDATNNDNRFHRNRMRNELLPHLEMNYSPNLRARLGQVAKHMNEVDSYFRDRAKASMKKLCLDSAAHKVCLSIPAIHKLSTIEQYYVLKLSWSQITGTEADFFRVHLDELQVLMDADGSKYINLPHGVYAKKQYHELILTTRAEDIYTQKSEACAVEADRARVACMNYRFTFKYLKVLPQNAKEHIPLTAIIDADKISYPFSIRPRMAGDRFMPLGMQSSKKLKDFFIDEKVSKYDRDLIPIFDDGEKLFWVVGHRVDERVRFTLETQRYLMIEAEPIEEKPKRAANRKKNMRGYDEFDEL